MRERWPARKAPATPSDEGGAVLDAERSQRLREADLRVILESTTDGILAVDDHGVTIAANRRFAELWRIPQSILETADDAAMLSFVLDQLVDPEAFLNRVRALYGTLALDMDTLFFKDGRIFERYSAPLVRDGAAIGRVWSFRDITLRRRAEERQREALSNLQALVENVRQGVVFEDRERRVQFVNRTFCELFGITSPDVILGLDRAATAREIAATFADPRAFLAGVDRRLEERSIVLSEVLDLADGRTLERDFIPVSVDDLPHGNYWVYRDITERHLLEEERLKTQKLEAVGTLAGGIAHDFNNLLQGVFGYISMAKLKLASDEPAYAHLEQAEQALQMSVNLTRQLLTFSKGGKPVRKRVALKAVIGDSARFALSGSRCDHELRSDPDLWPVDADEGQIGQVIQNIVLNASEAMPAGGTVVITARNMSPVRGGHPSLPEAGRFVRVEIRDTGTGIPEGCIARIFDPYFTTKRRGSGLGLATSYSIVRNHGGTIEVQSQEGVGSVFIVDLPAAGASTPGPDPTLAPDPAPAKHARILVMDDEQIVCEVVGEMLGAMGHEVTFAKDGGAAIEAYRAAREAGTPFDLVILDLTVRHGMGGGEAMAKLREIDPGVVAVVSSGYSDDAIIADYAAHGFRAFLQKPFDLKSLGTMLSSVLE